MTGKTPHRGYAPGPFGQVHYRTLGEGPPLILLHQAPMTSEQFDNVYAPLAGHGLKAIGVDMPGFGMSDSPDFAPRVEDYAKAVPAVLDALGIAKAAVVGHHTGALVASEVSVQFPDRVSAVILAGPLPLTEDERQAFLDRVTTREKAFKALPGGTHLADLFALRESMSTGTVPLERLSQYVIQALQGRGEFWHGHHAAFQYHHDLSIMNMTHPTLILTNTGDQIYEHALRVRAMRPDFAFVELQGHGIDIVDQAPEEWSAAVAQFLKAQAA
jgi:pimeloyl-ACP methyl ester carboxylesterase